MVNSAHWTEGTLRSLYGSELHTGQAAHCNSAVMQGPEDSHTEVFPVQADKAGLHW